MKRSWVPAFFLLGAAVLLLYACIFPVLTIDTLTKVAENAGHYESKNLLLLLFLELGRLFTTLVGIITAVVLIASAWRRADARALSVCLLFSVITLEKMFGSNGYPGPLQERATDALLNAGASPDVLLWLFGPLPWTAWPALGALLRFSAVMPRPIDASALEASARADRRGLMRSTGVAGADIGAAFRKVANAMLKNGGFTASRLFAAVIILAAFHTLLHSMPAVRLLLWLIGLLMLCLVITNLRAAYLIAEGTDRVRLNWVAEGILLGVCLFIISGAVLIVIPGMIAHMGAFVLMMLMPLAVTCCLALSVLDRGQLNAGAALHGTVRSAAVWLAIVVLFGACYRVFTVLTDWLGMPHALAGLAAVVICALGFDQVRIWTDRARLRIMELPQ